MRWQVLNGSLILKSGNTGKAMSNSSCRTNFWIKTLLRRIQFVDELEDLVKSANKKQPREETIKNGDFYIWFKIEGLRSYIYASKQAHPPPLDNGRKWVYTFHRYGFMWFLLSTKCMLSSSKCLALHQIHYPRKNDWNLLKTYCI